MEKTSEEVTVVGKDFVTQLLSVKLEARDILLVIQDPACVAFDDRLDVS